MDRFLYLILFFAWLPSAFGGSLMNCPILSPVFPAPQTLNVKILESAFQNLTETLNHDVSAGNSTHGIVDKDTAYSVQFFSIYEESSAFEWYYTPPSIQNSSFGTKKVNGDSIFRIGSITNLFTVYALLTELGDTYWNQSVTNFIPELKGQSQKSFSDPINYLDWDDVTLGALASHLAGVARDLESQGDLSLEFPSSLLQSYGFPPIPQSDLPPCRENATIPCNRSKYLAALATRQPIYAPNTTPVYSNTGFQILAFALESIAGRTSTNVPSNDSRGVIPGNPGSSGWNYDLGQASGFSGTYTTTSDLAKVGKAILNATLLDANITRAWLKPVSHTSSLVLTVGRLWEIARQTLSPPYEHVTDIYTKTGSENMYNSLIALMPDYNVGFVTLAAGPGSDAVIDQIIIDAIVPNLEVAAREQAEAMYAGTYTASGLNSSITLGTHPNVPGLLIEKWTSNGKNMFEALSAIYGFPVDTERVVLQPTNLVSPATSAGNVTGRTAASYGQNVREVAFRAIYEQSSAPPDFGVYAEACVSWLAVDAVTYGDFVIDQFLFTMATDENRQEKARSITPRFLHLTLERED